MEEIFNTPMPSFYLVYQDKRIVIQNRSGGTVATFYQPGSGGMPINLIRDLLHKANEQEAW